MGRYDDAWAETVAASAWPARLSAAVRDDPIALASSRAVETLRAWRSRAASGDTEAKLHLEQIAAALAGGARPTTPARAREVLKPLEDDGGEETDPRTPSLVGAPPARVGSSTPIFERRPPPPPPAEARPSEDEVPEDEVPEDETQPRRRSSVVGWQDSTPGPGTQVIREAAILEEREISEPRLGVAEPRAFEGAEPPTTTLPLNPRDGGSGSATGTNEQGAVPQLGEHPTHHVELEMPLDEPASSARRSGAARSPRKARSEAAPAALAETDGPRPPAAAAQVRALAQVLRPLAEELVPLTHQRRERRFWARWREVAGDRGVRRELVEELLARARSADELLTGLIAEVQSVDRRSVAEHLSQIDGSPGGEAPPPSPSSERSRGPLVGASVRVEGVIDEE